MIKILNKRSLNSFKNPFLNILKDLSFLLKNNELHNFSYEKVNFFFLFFSNFIKVIEHLEQFNFSGSTGVENLTFSQKEVLLNFFFYLKFFWQFGLFLIFFLKIEFNNAKIYLDSALLNHWMLSIYFIDDLLFLEKNVENLTKLYSNNDCFDLFISLINKNFLIIKEINIWLALNETLLKNDNSLISISNEPLINTNLKKYFDFNNISTETANFLLKNFKNGLDLDIKTDKDFKKLIEYYKLGKL